MAHTIDDFNRLGGVHLYARFAFPAMVKVSEFDTHGDLLPEETNGRHAVYSAAVEFLADEGYLRYGSQAGGARYFGQGGSHQQGIGGAAKDNPSHDRRRRQRMIRQGIRDSFGVRSE